MLFYSRCILRKKALKIFIHYIHTKLIKFSLSRNWNDDDGEFMCIVCVNCLLSRFWTRWIYKKNKVNPRTRKQRLYRKPCIWPRWILNKLMKLENGMWVMRKWENNLLRHFSEILCVQKCFLPSTHFTSILYYYFVLRNNVVWVKLFLCSLNNFKHNKLMIIMYIVEVTKNLLLHKSIFPTEYSSVRNCILFSNTDKCKIKKYNKY